MCSLVVGWGKVCGWKVERWSEQVGGNVGLRTINERINQIEPCIEHMRASAFPTSPSVVQLDGIWVTIQSQEEKIKPDKRKRRRKQRTGKKIVILVALGLWEDGRREILDWQLAPSEEHTHWEVLLNRLWTREVQPEKGLQMIVRDGSGGLGEAVALVYGSSVLDQRCIFHKLKNVADKARSELKGEEKREERKQLDPRKQKRSIRPKARPRPKTGCICGVNSGVNALLKPLPRWRRSLRTPSFITNWRALPVNGYVPPPCLNAPIENCAANFAKQ